MEVQLANISKKEDVHVLAALNCCRSEPTTGIANGNPNFSGISGIIKYACGPGDQQEATSEFSEEFRAHFRSY